MSKILFNLFLFSILAACHPESLQPIILRLPEGSESSLSYPLTKLKEQLLVHRKRLDTTCADPKKADLVVQVFPQKTDEPNDGYTLEKKGKQLVLRSEGYRGLLYGLLYITDELKHGTPWTKIREKRVSAHYPFRAIKFNLPWYSYRSGKNLELHSETCRDLKFWEAFLDMMVENKFNTLTLWSLHPCMYMVKSEKFPEASPFFDDEMAEWQAFWKQLFLMAKNRGIDTYVVNWNIFVPEEFAKKYETASYANSNGFWGEGETNPVLEE